MKKFALTFLLASNLLTVMANPKNLFPISLKNLRVEAKNNDRVEVKWDIIHQNSAKGFSVQHSIDGSNWKSVGYVIQPKNNNYKRFVFNHNNSGKGQHHYRIHLVDSLGDLYYSERRTIILKTPVLLSVWPNPAQHFLKIQNNNIDIQFTRAAIFTPNGIKVTEITLIRGINTIDIQSLNPGSYIVRLELTGTTSDTYQFIKQ